MKQIIENAVNWESIGDYPKDALTYSIDRAVIHKDSGVLSIDMTLNFVMPHLDMEKLKATLIHKLDGIQGVKLNYSYENVVLRQEDIVRLFIPHMIEIVNGEYTAITKTIRENHFQFDGKHLEIEAIGKVSTQQLNEKVKKLFEHLLEETFGIQTSVSFVNNEDIYEQIHDEMEAGEKQDIEESMKKYKEAKRKQASQNPSSGPSGSSGTAGGGGFGGSQNGGFGGQGGQNGQGGWKRKEKELPAEGNRIMGHDIVGDANTALMDIDPSLGTVIVEGILFKKDHRVIRSGNFLITLLITDEKTTICCKCFASENKWKEIDDLLKPGAGVKIRGEVQFDTFENMNTIMMKDIEKTDKSLGDNRKDTCEIGKRVELHAHTKMSAMDGLNEVSDIVGKAAVWGQPAVAITDHGVVQAFPDAAKEAKKQAEKGRPIKILYGMEGYVFDDSDCIKEDGSIDYKKKGTNHIILLAATQEGLKNIYKLVSFSHIDYFYRRPRLPWSVLEAHREGILVGRL